MDRLIAGLARITAVIGGIVLCAVVLMTCISIVGRALSGMGLGPVLGDFELVEVGTALAVFCFMPWCTLVAGHATVDVFTNMLSRRSNRYLVAFWEVVMALTLCFIAWRLYEGLLGKIRNGETSFLLQFPIWWAYGASMIPAVVSGLVALWSAWDRIRTAFTGHETRSIHGEVQH